MAGKYSLELLDVNIQRGGSWFRGWVSDPVLREPVKLARSILREWENSVEYVHLLHKLFWATLQVARINGENENEAIRELCSEHKKDHVLAAVLLGAAAHGHIAITHFNYQRLVAKREDQLRDLAREAYTVATEANDAFQRAHSKERLTSLKAHILRKDKQRLSGKANAERWGAANMLCKNAANFADELWSSGDSRDHAAMARYLVDDYEEDHGLNKVRPFSGLAQNMKLLRKTLKDLAEKKHPNRVRGKPRR